MDRRAFLKAAIAAGGLAALDPAAWAREQGRDAVAVIDVPSFQVVSLIPVGARPQGIVYLHGAVPDRVQPNAGLGHALAAGRTFPEGCPDPCCVLP